MTEWHLGPGEWDSCKGLCSYHSYFSPQRKLRVVLVPGWQVDFKSIFLSFAQNSLSILFFNVRGTLQKASDERVTV